MLYAIVSKRLKTTEDIIRARPMYAEKNIAENGYKEVKE